MKFRTKLFVGFSTILSLLLIFTFIVLRMFFTMNQTMHGIVDDDYAKVKFANLVRTEINSLNTETNELLLDANLDKLKQRLDKIQETKAILDTDLIKLEQMFEDQPDPKRLAMQILKLHGLFIESNNTAVDLLMNNKKDQAIDWHNSNTEPITKTLFDTIKEFNSLQEQSMDQSLDSSTANYKFTIRLIIALVAITLLFGIFVAVYVFRSVVKSLGDIISVMKQAALAEGNDQLPRIVIETEDEMASIGHAYNLMAIALEEHAKYQKQANLILQEQNWNKSKVAEITALYQGVQNLTGLAEVFISAISPALGASYGVFYSRKGMESGLNRLIKAGTYATDNKEIGAESIAFGEGLAGQCAAQNKMIILTQPPKDYIQISSGLGTASPVQIVIVPVQFENNVVAVIELASFREFTQAHLHLLEELTDILGITVNSISGHMQIQQLLYESQLFTDELQTQSEELQLQQEELKTLNEQLEDQIKASEKKSTELEKIKNELEEKNKHVLLASGYKSEFLANMSHELRTPLNSLLILSQMLAKNKEGNLNPKQIEFSQTIYSSGKDLLGLINEVLDLSKIESGKLELDFDWVKLKNFTNFVERQFEPIANDKGLQFQVRIDDEISDIMIYTDEQRLQQILQNLLSNAFKFTEQGSISLGMHMIPKEEVKGSPIALIGDFALAISVSDTGIGIPKEQQAVIFEAFRQADGTTSRKYGGTGLGLSICQKIAQLLNGFIRIESEDGIGSTFTVYIPISKVRSELALSKHEAAAALAINNADSTDGSERQMDIPLEGKKILLVDDDLRNIYALTTFLETYHIHVIFAENGQEGINLLYENTDTDLVIMDIMMPKMDGYEAIKEIRKNPKFESLPIIALTAKAMKYDREKCIEAGANDYISKPILLDQLLSLIRVWMYR